MVLGGNNRDDESLCIAEANGDGTDEIERVAEATCDDRFTIGALRWERARKDGKFVVGLDEAQLLDKSVVAHVGCASQLVTGFRHGFGDISGLGWVGGISFGEALEVLGGCGLNSGVAKGWIQHGR